MERTERIHPVLVSGPCSISARLKRCGLPMYSISHGYSIHLHMCWKLWFHTASCMSSWPRPPHRDAKAECINMRITESRRSFTVLQSFRAENQSDLSNIQFLFVCQTVSSDHLSVYSNIGFRLDWICEKYSLSSLCKKKSSKGFFQPLD